MVEVQRKIALPGGPDAIWPIVSDPMTVVACIPGASLTSNVTDGKFDGEITVAFGGLRVPFRGTGLLRLDDRLRRGTLEGRGKDKSGGTRFHVVAEFVVTGSDCGRTLLDLGGRVDIAGRLAPLIEAGAATVIESMLSQFTLNLGNACERSANGRVYGADELQSGGHLPAGLLLPGVGAGVLKFFGRRLSLMWSRVRRAGIAGRS
jgi:uncharacterized protein